MKPAAQMLLAAAICRHWVWQRGRAFAAWDVVSGGGDGQAFSPRGYASDHPLIPHGMSVILHTPAVVRFTASASPRAASCGRAVALGADVRGASSTQDAGDILAQRVIHFMRLLNMPNGLAARWLQRSRHSGRSSRTLPQHRVTKLSPRPAGEKELTELFRSRCRSVRSAVGVQRPQGCQHNRARGKKLGTARGGRCL